MQFYFRTLGCKVNWLDTARLSAALQASGHVIVADESLADCVVVNSCTVTSEAERKSRQSATAALRRDKQVVVIGCSPKVDRERWLGEGSETLAFADEQAFLRHFGVEVDRLPFPLTSRTRLPVMIQTGCDNECSFCITRVARGGHRTIPAGEIVDQIREAEVAGIREVVLTGINLAAWGCDDTRRPEGGRLPELIDTILEQTTIPRLRFSSLGPEFLDRAFFERLADPRLCDYLHLSVQSGSASVLKRMERGHGTAEILAIAEQARAARPDVAIACDMIVGFPGETEAEFAETLQFSRDIAFAKMHIFPYSKRDGTPAAGMAREVDGPVRKGRAAELRELAKSMRETFLASQLGKKREVLIEGRQSGLTGNYIRVRIPIGSEGSIRLVTLNADNLLN